MPYLIGRVIFLSFIARLSMPYLLVGLSGGVRGIEKLTIYYVYASGHMQSLFCLTKSTYLLAHLARH